MDSVLQDLRYAVRVLAKARGFTVVAVLTLALGIGANTAMFSIVNGVLLRPLPFQQPGQLVRIETHFSTLAQRDIGLSVPELQDLRANDAFEQVSGVWPADAALSGIDHASRVELLATSANYFSMLGAKPQLGRLFGPEDDKPGFAEAVVLSDGLWRRAFGADPHVIGRSLRLDNDAYTVVGVLPPEFHHPGPTVEGEVDLWATAGFSANPFPAPQRSVRLVPGAIARLRPGVTIQQAQQRLNAYAANIKKQFPDDYKRGWSIEALPLRESLVHDSRALLSVLMGAASLILLIACVNIANLLLVRATARQREIAIRAAVGATRVRLVRQMLTESVVLALVAGVLGVLATSWGMGALLHAVPSKLPRLHEITIGRGALGFGLAVSLLTGLLFGLMPALRSSHASLAQELKEGGRVAGGERHRRLRAFLVTSELALSLMLLIGAGLLLRTFWSLLNTDPGFRPDGIQVANVWIPVPNDPKTDRYATPGERSVYVREVLRRVRTLPGVDAAAMTTMLPMSGRSNRVTFRIEGRPEDTAPQVTELISITPDYFRTLGAQVRRGRDFTEDDDTTRPNVIVIDESTARRFWPGEDAIGKRLILPRPKNSPAFQVVGVVRDIRHDGVDADFLPHIYVSMYQLNNKVLSVIAHTRGTELTESALRGQLETVDPELPIFGVTDMEQTFRASLAQRRFAAGGVMMFAVIAILLAAIGLYGVIGYSVSQRTHELGVRMALGARPLDVVTLVLREGAVLTLVGVGAGLVMALMFSRVLRSLLYGVPTVDPMVFIAGSLLLGFVALLAGYVPAHRAARIDPLVALRHE